MADELAVSGWQVQEADLNTLGGRLAARRREVGLTAEELSEQTHAVVHPAYIAQIEAGDTRGTDQVVSRLAEALGCTKLYLVSGVDDRAFDGLRDRLKAAEQARRTGRADHAWTIYEHALKDEPAPRFYPDLRQDVVSQYARALADVPGATAGERLRELVGGTEPGSRGWGVATAQLIAHRRRDDDCLGAIEVGMNALQTMHSTHSTRRWPTAAVSITAELLPTLMRAGDTERARSVMTKLEHQVAYGDHPDLQYTAHIAIADTAAHLGETARLTDHATKAYQFAKETGLRGQPTYLCAATTTFAWQMLRSGKESGVAAASAAVQRTSWSDQSPTILAGRDVVIAGVATARGRPEVAQEVLERVLDQSRDTGRWALPLETRGRAEAVLGTALGQLGDAGNGAGHLFDAAETLRAADRAGEAAEAMRHAQELAVPARVAPRATGSTSLSDPSADALRKATESATGPPTSTREVSTSNARPMLEGPPHGLAARNTGLDGSR